MNELAKEITGTMARDKQRSNATINRLVRAQELKAKAKALPPRPSNPNQCAVLAHAEQYRHDVWREISHLLSAVSKARLDPPRALLPPQDDDDSTVEPYSADDVAAAKRYFAAQQEKVRALNADLNQHLKLYNQWERRVVALGGEAKRQPMSSEHTVGGVTYFGAARLLPEYVEHVNNVRGAGKKSARSESALDQLALSREAVKEAYDDEEDAPSAQQTLHAFSAHTDATDSEYADFLSGKLTTAPAAASGAPAAAKVGPLLCLGGWCCTPPLPAHIAPGSVEALMLQLQGEARIGPDPRTQKCPHCDGDASRRAEWRRELEEMDRDAAASRARAMEQKRGQHAEATAAATVADAIVDELLTIQPFGSEDAAERFLLDLAKAEARERMMAARRK